MSFFGSSAFKQHDLTDLQRQAEGSVLAHV